jgi:hypothetical protein
MKLNHSKIPQNADADAPQPKLTTARKKDYQQLKTEANKQPKSYEKNNADSTVKATNKELQRRWPQPNRKRSNNSKELKAEVMITKSSRRLAATRRKKA